MLNARELVITLPPCAVARLDDICHVAISGARARGRRVVAYVPGRPAEALGCWNPPVLARALKLLVEEVLDATTASERVELRWDVDDDAAVVRVQFPRPLGSGERLVTFFDADASAQEDRRRLVAAREALIALGGTLARVRTLRGTTYVATVPRCEWAQATIHPHRSTVHPHRREPDVKQVTISEVKRLIATRADPAISIYVNRDPGRVTSDRERLRERLRRAADLLGEKLPRRRIDALLAPLVEHARRGLRDARSVAFLRSPGMAAVFELPIATPDLTVVASAFHTKPLVRVLDGAERFVVFAIGDGRASAYEGTPDRLRLMDAQFPVEDGPAAGARGWYRALDEKLRAELWDRGDPVVLAGTRDRRAGFSEVSRYGYVLDEGIECDLGQVLVSDLLGPAREIVATHQRHAEAEAVAQYLSATRAAGVTTDELDVVCRAAAHGRVRALLHERGAHVWGRVDTVTGACRVAAARRPAAGDGDVIDDLCQLVLRSGGDVVEVAPERMPTASPVAAVVSAPAWTSTQRDVPRVGEVVT